MSNLKIFWNGARWIFYALVVILTMAFCFNCAFADGNAWGWILGAINFVTGGIVLISGVKRSKENAKRWTEEANEKRRNWEGIR